LKLKHVPRGHPAASNAVTNAAQFANHLGGSTVCALFVDGGAAFLILATKHALSSAFALMSAVLPIME
jgi:hypothetical protein